MATRAVIFDLDGTLTLPLLDFDAIRREIEITGSILEAMAEMSPGRRAHAEVVLDAHEWSAARDATPQPGAKETVAELRDKGIPVGILTRNARGPAACVLESFGIDVDAVRTREDGVTKPAPDGCFALCEKLGAAPGESFMVGDYLYDIRAGRAAGMTTVLLATGEQPEFAGEADHVVAAIGDVLPIVFGAS